MQYVMALKQPPNREKFDYLFKILLLGDSGVGKTSVMWRFSDDVFTSTYISTIGIDFKLRTINVEGKRVRLQVWDTAGQERFHAISISYYRAAVGIMLVYDITRRFSFENIAKWLRNIEEHAKEDVVKLLVGNKSDMQDQRAVRQEEGEKLASEYDMLFFETSAKIDLNIDVAFQSITEEIMKRFVPEFRKPPLSAEPEKDCLVEMKKSTHSSKTLFSKKETRCC